ncbi:hypothetical protein [Baekduia soli]|nr:hypothetical protein [Baekduia soli]
MTCSEDEMHEDLTLGPIELPSRQDDRAQPPRRSDQTFVPAVYRARR